MNWELKGIVNIYTVKVTNKDKKEVTRLVRASCPSKAMEGFLLAFQGSRDIFKIEVELHEIINEDGTFS